MAKTALKLKSLQALTELLEQLKADEAEAEAEQGGEGKTNSFEGGLASFWDNDIDGPEDDAWAAAVGLALGMVNTK